MRLAPTILPAILSLMTTQVGEHLPEREQEVREDGEDQELFPQKPAAMQAPMLGFQTHLEPRELTAEPKPVKSLMIKFLFSNPFTPATGPHLLLTILTRTTRLTRTTKLTRTRSILVMVITTTTLTTTTPAIYIGKPKASMIAM